MFSGHFPSPASCSASHPRLFPVLCSQEMGKRKLTSLQPVDVLGIEAQEEPFVVQESQEIVGVVGSVVARVELLGQSEKGLGLTKK